MGNRTHMVVLILLVSAVTFGVFLQASVDRLTLAGAGGFALMMYAGIAMYYTLARELPDHPLVGATYLNVLGRRDGFRNAVALVRSHFERHGADVLGVLSMAGAALLAAALVLSLV